jgi:ankyrin repeat protein
MRQKMNDDLSLTKAINCNRISHVASLIAGGSIDVHGSDLRHAAGLGHVEIVNLLLDAGVHIDDVGKNEESACHIATFNGHIEVVRVLVARHANVLLQNRFDETPITIAIKRRFERILMLLIDAAMAAGMRPDDATICVAASVGTNVIQLLLHKHRIDLGAIRGDSGNTPLLEAAWRGSEPNVLNMLIDVAGIDIDARDENDYTAVRVACVMQNTAKIAHLVAAGANLDLADKNGNTPLHHTQFSSTDQFSVLLLAGGANVHARNNRGRTPCHPACREAHAASGPLLSALLAFGANLDEPDDEGVTPRQLLGEKSRMLLPTTEEIAMAHGRVLAVRLSFVRKRAFEVCIALHSLGLDALCMCEILQRSCGAVAPFVPFHIWWRFATLVKHHHSQNR